MKKVELVDEDTMVEEADLYKISKLNEEFY